MCLNPKVIFKKGFPLQVGCGKCFECLQERSRVWAYRVSLEASLYPQNCMITLTYNENNLPTASHLVKRDLQLFMKRLRKHYCDIKIRFFACGEYGSKNGRPHYHVILFNLDFNDKYFFCKDNKGSDLYRSTTLEKLWTYGFSSIGEVNFDSAKYCAIYMQKPPKDGRPKPFVLMSRRPGIGFDSIKSKWLATDKIYYKGKYIKIPRYFLDVLSRDFPIEVEILKDNRMNTALKFNGNIEATIEFENRLQRIKKLQKVFGKDFESYFEFEFDFDNYTYLKRENKIFMENLKKSLDN